MDFDLPEELLLLQKTAREFAEAELAPHAARLDREECFSREHWRKLAAMGFLGVLIPESYGGAGLNVLGLTVILEELNRACASTGVTVSVHNSLAAGPILKHGTEAQKAKYLPRLASGEIMGAYAITEPDCGSDAVALKTRATRQGGGYVLRGRKAWITNGASAGVVLVFATLDPALRSKGITAFLVESGSRGFSVGKHEKKLGIRGSETVELVLDDVEVPAENRLGEERAGFRIAMDTLDGGRIGIAAQAIGIAQASLDASIRYARERKQFGRPLAEFQAIQWKIADMGTEIEAARLLAYRAAFLRDLGLAHSRQASMAKLFASEAANRAATEAVQIHGGAGYCMEYPVERYFRDAKVTEIYEGTSEIQRIVISRGLLE